MKYCFMHVRRVANKSSSGHMRYTVEASCIYNILLCRLIARGLISGHMRYTLEAELIIVFVG